MEPQIYSHLGLGTKAVRWGWSDMLLPVYGHAAGQYGKLSFSKSDLWIEYIIQLYLTLQINPECLP